jgi:rSAM/selenodomain-associated transferase 2
VSDADWQLSVIIPAIDEAAQISGLLSSLQPLRVAGHQVILADGGSRDATLALAEKLVDRVVASERGRALQMNAGAREATGEILWFLHADTMVDTDAAMALPAVLRRSGRLWGRFDLALSGRRRVFRLIELLINWRSRLSGIATGDQGIFILHSAFDRVGGYPEIPLMEDVEISRRLKSLGRPLCLRLRLVTSSRRWENRGVLRTILLMWRLRLAYALGGDPAALAERYR